MSIAVEQWGTFDVANLGDVLFPVVLHRELERRLGPDAVDLRLRSPHGGAVPLGVGWPVGPIDRPDPDVAAIVLGGGDLLRLEPAVAGQLLPGATGWYRYDGFIGRLAAAAGHTTVIWNGVGVPSPLPPSVHAIVRELVAGSQVVSVRDETSKGHLLAAGVDDRDVTVVPDPASVADRLLPPDEAARHWAAVDPAPGADEVLAVHVSFAMPTDEAALVRSLAELLAVRPGLQLRLVPVGPCHGDVARAERMCATLGPRATRVAGDPPGTRDLMAAIATSDALVSTSLHANILALRYGVPGAFIALGAAPHKLTEAMDRLGRTLVVDQPGRLVEVAVALLDGRAPVDRERSGAIERAVDAHHDRVAAAIVAAADRPRGVDTGASEAREHAAIVTAEQAADVLAAARVATLTDQFLEAQAAFGRADRLAAERERRIGVLEEERSMLRATIEALLPGHIEGIGLDATFTDDPGPNGPPAR